MLPADVRSGDYSYFLKLPSGECYSGVLRLRDGNVFGGDGAVVITGTYDSAISRIVTASIRIRLHRQLLPSETMLFSEGQYTDCYLTIVDNDTIKLALLPDQDTAPPVTLNRLQE